MGLNLKTTREHFRDQGIFHTPIELAELMKEFIDIRDYDDVYDPTCGHGNLLSVFPDNIRKYGQEIDPEQARYSMEHLVNANVVQGNTLTEPAFIHQKFRVIMANPPFSVKWDNTKIDGRFSQCPYIAPASKADYAFILHILYMLADDGIAIIMCFPGVLYRGNSEGKIRRWLIEQNYLDKVVRIPGGKFIDTNIDTCLLILKKNRQTRRVEFIDKECELNRFVDCKEIESNDYILSVNNYVQAPEPDKPPIDQRKLEIEAQDRFIGHLKAQIKLTFTIAKIEGWDLHKRFLDKIKEVIKCYDEIL